MRAQAGQRAMHILQPCCPVARLQTHLLQHADVIGLLWSARLPVKGRLMLGMKISVFTDPLPAEHLAPEMPGVP